MKAAKETAAERGPPVAKRRRYEYRSREEAEAAARDWREAAEVRDQAISALLEEGVKWFEQGIWKIAVARVVVNNRPSSGIIILLDTSGTYPYRSVLTVDDWFDNLRDRKESLVATREGTDMLRLADAIRLYRDREWNAVS
jgi:hypothetical protein